MKKDEKSKCEVCGKETNMPVCVTCVHLLKHGASESTIKKMLLDKDTNAIWKENKELANRLASVYYESLLDGYDDKQVKKDSKENFGFNTFSDGINLGLDIVMPLLDKTHIEKAKEKIEMMLKKREHGK